MIGPVANPANICRGGRCQINIVQIVESRYNAALELHCCRAAGRHKIRKAEGTKPRDRIEIFKNHHAVKEDTKSVVWRRAGFHDLVEKRQLIGRPRRSEKGMADRVKVGTSRTK